jgi:hypothetical protein
MDAYAPESWHDFFLATAGASAALTGLLFVALSLHIRYIAANRRYRNMARGSLIGLVMVLILSLIALVREPTWLTGVELAGISVLYLVLEGGYQLSTFRRARWKVARATVVGSGIGQLLALVGIVGGLGLVFKAGPGLYAVAFISIVIVLWNLWDAWVLLMGVADEEIQLEAH